jgi:hypothetical protein
MAEYLTINRYNKQIPIFHIALQMWQRAGHSCPMDIFLIVGAELWKTVLDSQSFGHKKAT